MKKTKLFNSGSASNDTNGIVLPMIEQTPFDLDGDHKGLPIDKILGDLKKRIASKIKNLKNYPLAYIEDEIRCECLQAQNRIETLFQQEDLKIKTIKKLIALRLGAKSLDQRKEYHRDHLIPVKEQELATQKELLINLAALEEGHRMGAETIEFLKDLQSKYHAEA